MENKEHKTGRTDPKASAFLHAPSPRGAVPPDSAYYFLSEFLPFSVRWEGESASWGKLDDIGVQNTSPYPFVSSIRLRSGRPHEFREYSWDAVAGVSRKTIALKPGSRPGADAPDYWLRRDLLDDQVIDVSGAKVVRVNDLHLLYAEGRMLVAHVDVGLLGILRRLGCARFVLKLLDWLFDYTLKDALVSWRFVELAGSDDAPSRLRMATSSNRLAELHPAELADIMEQLGTGERQQILNMLPLEAAADALEEVDPELQKAFISQQEPEKAADFLEEMNSTDAADVLRDLHSSEAQVIIGRMEKEAAENIRAILAHEEKSAGGVMSTECIETRPEQLAGEVLEYVRSVADEAEVFNQIYVVGEKNRLVGVLSLRELLIADPEATLESFMETDVVSVDPEASLEEVAGIFMKYGFRAIPVVDDGGTFLGAIRLVNVLDKLSRFFREE